VKIQILSIGNEVVFGDIVNTNAAWLSEELSLQGFQVESHFTIPDDEKLITESLRAAAGKVDAVISTGGLGPTVDDFTVEIAAKTFGLPLEKHPEVLKQLHQYYVARNRTMTPNQEKQSLVPLGGEAFINPVGSAPGVHVCLQGVDYFFLPGVPKEMKEIFSQSVLPRLIQKRQPVVYAKHKILRCFGAEEAKLDHLIQPLLKDRVQLGEVKLAFRVSMPEVLVKLSSLSADEKHAEKVLHEAENQVRKVVGKYIYGEGNQTLEEVTGVALASKHKTLAVAESCTGGLLAHRLTNIPGSSRYFLGGVVAYSNEVKIKELGVSEQTLKNFGAVSEQVALEMAQGIRDRFHSDYSLAVTGIAGPDGGTLEKPVGTVWIACADEHGAEAKKFFFPFQREWFKLVVSSVAINWVRKKSAT